MSKDYDVIDKELNAVFDKLTVSEKRAALKTLESNVLVDTWIKRGIAIAVMLVVALMAGCPQYNVWQQSLSGKAELARAEQNRQIKIQEAMAEKESASFKAQAEIERARGVQQANQIIADGLGGPEGYLRYLFIDNLQSSSCNTIYIPMDGTLPVLEATRLLNGKPTKTDE